MARAGDLSQWLVMRDSDYDGGPTRFPLSSLCFVRRFSGFLIDNAAVLAGVDGPGSFQFMASLSRRALVSICCAFEFPPTMLPLHKGGLVNLCEVLVRNYVSNGIDYIRAHYYALWCDARNRCLWRDCVREDCHLPLHFSSMLGFRVRFSSYPARLFECTREYQEYYCAYLRGFMRLAASFVGWRGGWICPYGDVRYWGLRASDSVTVMFQRELFRQIALKSVSCCPTGWCPDMFEGLGAHSDSLWFHRPAPVVEVGGIGFYELTPADCIPLCRFVDQVCDRFPGLYESVYFRRVLALFINFLEVGVGVDGYLLGLPFHIELLVLRSQMLLGSHRGFVRWLGDYLPFVPVNPAGSAATPTNFLGVCREVTPFAEAAMFNFGEGGLVAENRVDYRGVTVPMRAESWGRVLSSRHICYEDVASDEAVVMRSFVTGELVELGPGYL